MPSFHQWIWIIALCIGGIARATPTVVENLEVAVWNASPATLQHVEKRLVHELTRENQDTSFLYYLLSLTYLRMFTMDPTYVKGLQQALQLAQEAIEMQPTRENGYLAMTEMLFALGKQKEALFLLHTFELHAQKEHFPVSWRLSFYLARTQSQDPLSLFTALEPLLEKESNENIREILLPYLVAALRILKPDPAYLEKLQALEAQFSNHFLRHELVATWLEVGNYKMAQKLCKKGLRIDPDDFILQVETQIINYQFSRTVKPAYDNLHKLEQIAPDSLLPWIKMHIGLALQLMKRGGEAQAYMRKAWEKKAMDPEFLETVHQAYIQTHEEPAFLSLLKNLQEDYANQLVLYAQLGRTASHLKQYPEALNWYDQGLLLEPEEATLQYNKSCVFALQGKEGEALQWLQQALELRPDLSLDAQHDVDFVSLQYSQAFQGMIHHSMEKMAAKAATPLDTTTLPAPAANK